MWGKKKDREIRIQALHLALQNQRNISVGTLIYDAKKIEKYIKGEE